MNEVHQQIGEEGLNNLVSAFYKRVKEDDLLSPMYPNDDWEGAQERLADFLIYRCGGSQKYIEERGHPRLRMRHMPFHIGTAERDRWLKLMGEAMDETGVKPPASELLSEFFVQTADFMRNASD
ncbi:MAG: globin [Verrucomicrobiota bacterium]|jgi:hemoglobin|nr:globin [Verrucomicrobiota bacterium]HAA88734.1 hemin transporter [Verrucomicrobiales bacterium]|tara:strand:+ start:974 stop:1345 length:372 start_codon:yes stop_codon:yes gene_type:complete